MAFIEVVRLKQTLDWEASRYHTHAHYQLYYLLEGQRIYYFNGDNIYNVRENCFVLTSPNTPHKTDGGQLERIIVNFDLDYFDVLDKEFVDKCFSHFSFQFDSGSVSELKGVVCDIEKEYHKGYKPKDDYLKVKLAELLILLSRNTHNILSSGKIRNPLIMNVLRYINDNYRGATLESVAKAFYVSKSHLAREFKKNMGVTTGEYILGKKISAAMDLLTNTSVRIQEVACACGFSSPNYFGLAFKKSVGISPQKYKLGKLDPASIK
jgi:AraC-like DNA-binding protein